MELWRIVWSCSGSSYLQLRMPSHSIAASSMEVRVMSESWLVPYRDVIRRRLLWLRLRYRVLLFLELALLGITAVLFVAIAVAAVNKVVYIPVSFYSSDTLLLAVGSVAGMSFLWASLRPVKDLELAAFIDREVTQPGMVESAVDFLSRPDEIDPLYLRPFLRDVARLLVSTPESRIIGLEIPRLWRVTAAALALLLVVHFFVPTGRMIGEEQDPFLIRDLKRMSMQFAGAALDASRAENLSREERELYEKAEELARTMAADSIDPDYLQDELSRLTKGINERSMKTRAASDELIARVLQEIERLRLDQANKAAQNPALEEAMKLLAASAIEMQDSSMQQRMRSAQDMAQTVQGLLEMSKDVLDPKELETIQRLIAELQSELERNSSLRNLSELSERALDLLQRERLEDLTSRRRHQLIEQRAELLRSYTATQQEGGTPIPGNTDSQEQQSHYLLESDSDAALGLLTGEDAPSDSAGGFEGFAVDQSLPVDVPGEGLGTSPGDRLYGPVSERLEGYRTLVDHRFTGEGDEIDLTLSTVLGTPAEGEVGMSPPDQLKVYSGAAYEGQILEGEYPERYKQIVSNYFDGLK